MVLAPFVTHITAPPRVGTADGRGPFRSTMPQCAAYFGAPKNAAASPHTTH